MYAKESHDYKVQVIDFMKADLDSLQLSFKEPGFINSLKVRQYLKKLSKRSPRKPSLTFMSYLAQRWKVENI